MKTGKRLFDARQELSAAAEALLLAGDLACASRSLLERAKSHSLPREILAKLGLLDHALKRFDRKILKEVRNHA